MSEAWTEAVRRGTKEGGEKCMCEREVHVIKRKERREGGSGRERERERERVRVNFT